MRLVVWTPKPPLLQRSHLTGVTTSDLNQKILPCLSTNQLLYRVIGTSGVAGRSSSCACTTKTHSCMHAQRHSRYSSTAQGQPQPPPHLQHVQSHSPKLCSSTAPAAPRLDVFACRSDGASRVGDKRERGCWMGVATCVDARPRGFVDAHNASTHPAS